MTHPQHDKVDVTLLSHSPAASERSLFTAKALFAAALIGAAVIFVVAWAELITGQIMIGFLQLPPVVVAATFLITIANRLAGRLWKPLALSAREMLVVYCFMLFASMITSRGLMEDLIPMEVGLNYYADPTNKWQELYFKYVQPWMVPWDVTGGPRQPIAASFFEGLRPGQSIPWRPWLAPTAAWLLLVAAVYAFMLFASAILYRLWADHELLSFPLVQLPLEMLNPEQSRHFLRNKLTWIGFSLPVVVFGINGAHMIWPLVPQIPLQIVLNQYLTGRPWYGMAYTPMYLSMAAVGFFYLLPSELLLSLWVFFLLGRAQEVFATALGFPFRGWAHACAQAFTASQTMGAYFVLVGYMAYASWPRLRELLAGRDEAVRHRRLLMHPRVALTGLAVAAVGILVWTNLAGMSTPVAILEFGVYLLVQAVIMARSTAESGLPMTEGSFTPLDVYRIAARPRTLGPRNLTMLAFTSALFTRDLRGIVLTGFLDGQKMGDGLGIPRRLLPGVFVAAVLFAIPLSALIHLYLPYVRGGVTMYSYVYKANATTQFWREHAPFMMGQDEFWWGTPIWFAVGGLVTAFLSFMRRQYVWWPFHPLAYALSCSWTVVVFWFPAMVAWLVKTTMGRYGGVKIYQRARPIFLGFIFGEFFMAVFWTLVSAVFHTQAPFFPWP